ncbi:hypothetical protein J3E69DRAFT_248596 [Trichoderma sp. SZMC 28015]
MIKFISTADPLLFSFLRSLSLFFFLEQKMVKWMWGEVRCRESNRLGSNSPALQSLLFTSIPRYTFFFWSRTTIYLDSRGESWTMLIILTTRIHSNEGTGIKRTYGVTSGVISFYLFHLCFYLLLFCFLLSLSGPRQTGGGEGRRKGEAAGAFSTLCLHLFEQVGE